MFLQVARVMLAVLLGAVLLVAGPGRDAAASGEQGTVEVEAQVGWGGKGLPGQTVPAVITLRNHGQQDLNGAVEVLNFNRYQPPPPPGSPPGQNPSPITYWPATAYGERVNLPAGGEKRLVVWFPLLSPERLEVRYRVGQEILGQALSSLQVSYSGPLPQAVGYLGSLPGSLERVRLPMPDGVPRAPLVLPLSGELFPPGADDIRFFSSLVVQGPAARQLTAAQRSSLASWVESGGHLILAGAPGELQDVLTAIPEALPGLTAGDPQTTEGWQTAARWLEQSGLVEGAASQAYLIPLTGWGETFGPPDQPLGRQGTWGQGKVTILGLDLAASPWNSSRLGQALWQSLLAVPEQEQEMAYIKEERRSPLDMLPGYLDQLPASAFPNWWQVGFFLLAFILVAGPLTYGVLRWRRRPEYAWLAVPLLGLLFAGGAYATMLRGGGSLLVNVLQVVQQDGAGQRQVATGVGVFAPTQPLLALSLAEPPGLVRVNQGYYRPAEMLAGRQEPSYTVLKGEDLEVSFSSLSQWSQRSLVYRQEGEETAGNLAADLVVAGDRLQGQVQNRGSLKLENVALLLGSEVQALGQLAPGEEAAVDLALPPLPSYNPQGEPRPSYPQTWKIFLDGGSQTTRGAAGGVTQVTSREVVAMKMAVGPVMYPGDYEAPPRSLTGEEQRRANLLENLMNYDRNGPWDNGWPLTLVAFSQQAAVDPGLKGLRREPFYLTLLLNHPAPGLEPGEFELPAGLTVPQVERPARVGMFGHNNLMGLDGGFLTFTLQPRLPAGARLEELVVRLPYFPASSHSGGGMGAPSSDPQPVGPGALEIYHPGRTRWEELVGEQEFTLPADFAGTGGEVRLRVNGQSSSSGQAFYFLTPSVAYRGVME